MDGISSVRVSAGPVLPEFLKDEEILFCKAKVMAMVMLGRSVSTKLTRFILNKDWEQEMG